MLRTRTGCSWKVELNELNQLAHGWPWFVVSHNIEVGYLLMFNFVESGLFDVTIFNRSYVEVVKKCERHDPVPEWFK